MSDSATRWTAVHQAFSVLHYLPEFARIHVYWVSDANHLILGHLLLLLSSIFPSIRIFSNALTMCAKLLQSCLTLCNPMDYNLPGSSVHGILQARILEWIAVPSSRGSYQPGMELVSPALAGRFFTTSPTWKAYVHIYTLFLYSFLLWFITGYWI